MTPIEALKVALSREKASIEMYENFSRTHTAIRDLLSFLVNEEQKHKKLIEQKISEITRY